MASNSAFDGATLLAAKELKTKTVIAAIFRIFIDQPLEPFCPTPDKHKIHSPGGRFGGIITSKKRARNFYFMTIRRTLPAHLPEPHFFLGNYEFRFAAMRRPSRVKLG